VHCAAAFTHRARSAQAPPPVSPSALPSAHTDPVHPPPHQPKPQHRKCHTPAQVPQPSASQSQAGQVTAWGVRQGQWHRPEDAGGGARGPIQPRERLLHLATQQCSMHSNCAFAVRRLAATSCRLLLHSPSSSGTLPALPQDRSATRIRIGTHIDRLSTVHPRLGSSQSAAPAPPSFRTVSPHLSPFTHHAHLHPNPPSTTTFQSKKSPFAA
jgi:hypothetical protein